MLFFLMNRLVCFCQTITNSASIKNEEAKKRVLYNLRNQNVLYSNQSEFDFINYLKLSEEPLEKIDYNLQLSRNEIEESKAIVKWKQHQLAPRMRQPPGNYLI